MNAGSVIGRVGKYKKELAEQLALGGKAVVSASEVGEAAEAIGYRFRVRRWPPWLTVLGFLTQVLEQDQSCRNAVAKVWAWGSALRQVPASSNTGPYCEARRRLPEALLSRMSGQKAQQLEGEVRPEELFHGRRVRIADGGCVSMPDTPENQHAYPQPPGQKAGCGFPVARIAVMFGLVTGAILGLAIGSLHVGELVLSHALWSLLSAGDILLGDRGFCAYADIVLLGRRGVDVVFRQHQRRKSDFRKGRRLGRCDRLVTWVKCGQAPKWLGREAWNELPEQLILRAIRFPLDLPGFRSQRITIVTTLLDPIAYPAKELIALYRERWLCELDFRSVKAVMHMDILRGKTPAMVRKEIHMHLLAYNLVRELMGQAARRTDQTPRRLSFKGTLQGVCAFWPLFVVCPARDHRHLYESLLAFAASQTLPFRPNRIEPRKVKRRPKPYPLLTEPRHQARRRVIA